MAPIYGVKSLVEGITSMSLRRVLTVGDVALHALTEVHGEDEVVVHAEVYDEDSRLLGLVQAARADGSAWMISLGDGWLPHVEVSSLHDAIDVVVAIRSQRLRSGSGR